MSLKFRGQTARTPIASLIPTLALAISLCPGFTNQAAAQNSPGVSANLGDTPAVKGEYYLVSPSAQQTAIPPIVQSVEFQPAPPMFSLQTQNSFAGVTAPDCAQCTAPETKSPKANPCATSHKPLFYTNDFSYLNSDDNDSCCFGDSLKQLGPQGRLDIGGQIRTRYHSESGMGQQAGATRFQNTQNDFLLARLRLYADLKVSDRLRLYTEGIYSDVLASNADYVPRGIDRNFGDLTNFFLDIKVTDNSTVRVGRQELLFGSQRLVSPLDWSNTRRTFDAARVISTFDDWKLHAFYGQFVPVSFDEFDNSDENRELYGTFGTYSGMENSTLDLYALGFRDTRGGAGKSIVTFGSRLNGSKDKWLYELEGMVQTGEFRATGDDIEAYAWTTGLGRQLDGCWKPKVWFFYDYASGNSPSGSTDAFDELFPLGHKYHGFIDAVRRSNLKSPNAQLSMSPAKRLGILLWYHNFTAAERTDNISSLGGTPAQDPALSDFGNELDFVATFKASARTNVLAGYSHLWAGDKILSGTDADFFYLQWQTNF